MGVRGAGLGVSLAVTLRAAVENREMRYVPRDSVRREAHDEEGLGRSPLLPPVGVGVGVGLPPTGVDEGSLPGGLDEGSLPGGVDGGLLSEGVEEGISESVELGVLPIRLLVLLSRFPNMPF